MASTLNFKPVFFSNRGLYVYGQVVAVANQTLTVRSPTGDVKVTAARAEEIAPVICLLLQHARIRVREVPTATLDAHHVAILDRVLGQNGSAGTRVIEDILHGILPAAQVPDPQSMCSWLDPTTNATVSFHLRHAVDYVHFVVGEHPIPREMRPLIGDSFMDEPPAIVAPEHGASDARTSRTTEPNPSLTALLDEFERDADRAPPRSAQEELVKMISSKPHVLAFYIDQCLANPRKRSAPDADDSSRPNQRSRLSPFTTADDYPDYDSTDHRHTKEYFRPSHSHKKVHDAIIAPKYSGKTPSTFLDITVSSPARQFMPHLGFLTSLYDFEFGVRGISITHLSRFDMRGKAKWSREKQPSLQSVSKGADIPPRPTMSRLQDLRDNLTVLETFASEFFDSTTCQLISDAVTFSTRLPILASWHDSDVMEIADWFDELFQDYRLAVETWLNNGPDERDAIRKRLNEFNPQFLLLLFNVQSSRQRWAPPKSNGAGSPSPRQSETRRKKVPEEVLAAIPRHNGKSVCMRHLSQRGCPSTSAERCTMTNLVHFVPSNLPPVVRQYIEENLGGIRDKFD